MFFLTLSFVSAEKNESGCERPRWYAPQLIVPYEPRWEKREYVPTADTFSQYNRPLLRIQEDEVFRYVFVDGGARDPKGSDSAIRKFVRNQYFQKHAFEIFAFEADSTYFGSIKKAKNAFPPHNITLLPYAIWVSYETLDFSGQMGQLTATGPRQDLQDFEKTVDKKVQGLDFSRWLKKNFVLSDFVIVKLDIEEAEYKVIPHLISTGAICLIDELYVEIHFNRLQSRRPGRQNRNHTWNDVVSLGKEITASNTYYHLWF